MREKQMDHQHFITFLISVWKTSSPPVGWPLLTRCKNPTEALRLQQSGWDIGEEFTVSTFVVGSTFTINTIIHFPAKDYSKCSPLFEAGGKQKNHYLVLIMRKKYLNFKLLVLVSYKLFAGTVRNV